jgi:translation elongation factor P/translation initiation factor 5A
MTDLPKKKNLLRALDYKPLSPIPEVANSACISPEVPTKNEKPSSSKSAKVLSPKLSQTKLKSKRQELRLRNKFLGTSEKKTEDFFSREEKVQEIKMIKFSKTPKIYKSEKILPESISPNRILQVKKIMKKQKSGSAPKFNRWVWRENKERFGLGNMKEGDSCSKNFLETKNSQFLARRSNKAFTAKMERENHFEVDCKEIQDIVKKFAEKMKKRNVGLNN